MGSKKVFSNKITFFKKGIDKTKPLCYNFKAFARKYGGVAQLARAIGSYPIGHGFKSNLRYQKPSVTPKAL